MRMNIINGADLTLVELRNREHEPYGMTPHCKLHGAMNKFTPDGIWRCCSSYLADKNGGMIKENACKAGCEYK